MNVYYYKSESLEEYNFFEIVPGYGLEVEVSTSFIYFSKAEDVFIKQERDFNPNKLSDRSKKTIINHIFGKTSVEHTLVKDMFQATEWI